MSTAFRVEAIRVGRSRTLAETRQFDAFDRILAFTYLAISTAIYFPMTCLFAARKAFGFDELFTYYVAALPDARSIWNALLNGMDNNSPLDYLVRHFSMQWFGLGELGDRLPSICAFYIAFLCLFLLGRQLHSTLAGVLASSILLVSPAVFYSIEGRGYALILACASAAMLVWHRLASDENAPRWMWAALSACLSAAMWFHYYGVILMMAFVCAGIADWITRRRMPTRLIAAGIGASIGAAPLIPFASNARRYAAHFWARPSHLPVEALHDSISHFGSGLGLVMTVAACAFLCRFLPRTRWSRSLPAVRLRVPVSEQVLITALMFAPLLTWALAITVTGAYSARYTIMGAVGGSAIAGWALARSCGSDSRVAVIVTMACLALVPSSLVRLGKQESRKEMVALAQSVEEEINTSPVPVVSSTIGGYLQTYHYGSARLKRSLVALSDRDAALRLGHADTGEIALRNLMRFVPVRFEGLRQFVESNPRLRLTAASGESWLVTRLRETGYRLSLPQNPSSPILYEGARN